jgi:hypothetical protein
MGRQQPLDSFNFNHQVTFEDDIQPIPAIQSNAFIEDRQRHLSGKRGASLPQLQTEAFSVCGFTDSGPERSVHDNRETNHAFGQRIAVGINRH